MKTAPWSISLRASAAETSGFDWSSSISSSILRPSTPPFLLISLAPNTMPSVAGSEYGFETPTRSVMTPILMVSCAWTAPATSAAASNATNFIFVLLRDVLGRRPAKAGTPFKSRSSVQQPLLVHPAEACGHGLLQQLRLALIVMGCALDDMKRLVPAPRRGRGDWRVGRRHGVVGRVLDREQRHGDRLCRARAVGVRVFHRPMRQPRP